LPSFDWLAAIVTRCVATSVDAESAAPTSGRGLGPRDARVRLGRAEGTPADARAPSAARSVRSTGARRWGRQPPTAAEWGHHHRELSVRQLEIYLPASQCA